MTSSSHRNSPPRGFTLVELLVVIGIIVLLATILLPMANHAYNVAKRARMAADLQVIGGALEAYRHDFGDYPRPSPTPPPQSRVVTGAAILCWALVAPGPASQDGYGDPNNQDPNLPGAGFRLRGTTGTVQGPYLPPDRFRIGIVIDGTVTTPGTGAAQNASIDDTQDVLADRNYSPILYFVATRGADPSARPNGFIGSWSRSQPAPIPTPLFNFDDNAVYLSPPPTGVGNLAGRMNGPTGIKVMGFRLGDTGPGMPNGIIDPGETPLTTGPYLLWCAGPSVFGRFGNDDDVASNGTELQLVTPLQPGIAP